MIINWSNQWGSLHAAGAKTLLPQGPRHRPLIGSLASYRVKHCPEYLSSLIIGGWDVINCLEFGVNAGVQRDCDDVIRCTGYDDQKCPHEIGGLKHHTLRKAALINGI
ncbi:hypothetical protein B4916_23155 [Yersinia intermedia]|nr:hypothetical protein B4916_23155 [Yersinia intermedia]